MAEFEGSVAIVTGASSGIGRATAELLVREGARVAIFARSGDKLTDMAGRHERMIAVAGDAADENALRQLVETTEKRFGPCDILINNAGMIDPAPLTGTSTEQWDRMFAVNVRSVFLGCRLVLPSMLKRGGGAIVNVSSISGVIGPDKFPGWVSYCASKGAVISLTEALAVELRDKGVRVNCVSPGAVDTPMWAKASGGAPASMTAEEVAETIAFLASPRSRPLNGQNIHVYSS